MLRSKYCLLSDGKELPGDHDECRYDIGGYFIINGNEKVIVAQEKMAENKSYCFKHNKHSSRYSHTVEIKSIFDETFITPKNISIKLTSKVGQYGRTLKVFVPHIRLEIPLFVMFRALGIITDKDIIKHIVYDIDDANIPKIKLGCISQ